MPSHGCICPNESDPILRISTSYRDHPRIKSITLVFNFTQINIQEVKKSCKNLDPKKASQKDDSKTNLLCRLFCKVHAR